MNTIAAVLVALSLSAEGAPVNVWTGADPSGACKGNRIVQTAAGKTFSCVTSTWTNTTPSGMTTGPQTFSGSKTFADPVVLDTTYPGWSGATPYGMVIGSTAGVSNWSMINNGLTIRHGAQPSVAFINTSRPSGKQYYQINSNWNSILEFNNAGDEGASPQTICQMDFYNSDGANTDFACVGGISAGWYTSGEVNWYLPASGTSLKRNRAHQYADGSMRLERVADNQSSAVAIFTMIPRDASPWYLERTSIGLGPGNIAPAGTVEVWDTYPTYPTRFWVRENSAQSTNESFGVYASDGTTPRLSVANGKVAIGSSGTGISGSYRGSATLATSAISANLCAAELSVTVTSAAAGADCVVGMPSTIENGLVWSCYVSAAGTAKVRVCNHTAGSITPAGSQTVAVRVFNP